jgi:putative colanic acid biosynthesis UDP-glucose lipid carrier transferase
MLSTEPDAGHIGNWQLNDSLLSLFGLLIYAVIFLGEHVRSRAYERLISVSRSPSLVAESPGLVADETYGPSPSKDGEHHGRAADEHPLTRTDRFIKRAFDIVLASAALIALAPLFIIAAIAIKFDSPGPAILRQRRLGAGGRTFAIYKFRTIVVSPTRRVTKLGRWLRRTSCDELPQLFNVLWGDMSLIGPRPHSAVFSNDASSLLEHHMVRHKIKLGLTGWAQIHGFRGSLKSAVDFERRVEYDLWYIDNWSLWLDVRILFMTAFRALRSVKRILAMPSP